MMPDQMDWNHALAVIGLIVSVALNTVLAWWVRRLQEEKAAEIQRKERNEKLFLYWEAMHQCTSFMNGRLRHTLTSFIGDDGLTKWMADHLLKVREAKKHGILPDVEKYQ